MKYTQDKTLAKKENKELKSQDISMTVCMDIKIKNCDRSRNDLYDKTSRK